MVCAVATQILSYLFSGLYLGKIVPKSKPPLGENFTLSGKKNIGSDIVCSADQALL